MIQEELRAIALKLKAWFPPEAHKERELPGSGKWFFVPWQLIRERLDEVVPDAEVSYSTPIYLGDYCSVTCTIAIFGLKKQGIGNAEIELLSSKGKNMARGTPIERATADAFKNAAEAWGICRYLDDQASPETKAAFIRYMNGQGDGRAASMNITNQVGDRRSPANTYAPFGQSRSPLVYSKKPEASEHPNTGRIKVWVGATRIKSTDINRLRIEASLPEVEKMTEVQMIALRAKVLAYWAQLQGVFNDAEGLEKSVLALGDKTDRDLFEEWMHEIRDRLSDQPETTANVERIQALMNLTGHAPAQVKTIRVGLFGDRRAIASYTFEDMAKLRDTLFVDWASKFDVWNHEYHKAKAFNKILNQFEVAPEDGILLEAWKADCDRRKQEKKSQVQLESSIDA